MRHQTVLRVLVGLTSVAVLCVAAVLVRWLFYREVDAVGRAAQQRVAGLVGLPEEALKESDARCRTVGRLLRGGPIYLRFSDRSGAVQAVLERWQLTEQTGEPVVDRPSDPIWWPESNEAQQDFAFYENERMKAWVRRADRVCFAFISGG